MVMRATQKLLPTPAALKQRTIALAVLEVILSPESSHRYFLFDPVWAPGEQMAKQSDGEGDDLFIVFAPEGVFLLGFDHESEMSPWTQPERGVWPGIFDAVPQALTRMVNEPAFDGARSTTFCLWRENADGEWHTGEITYPANDPGADGSESLLAPYVEGPDWYVEYVSEYYEKVVARSDVESVFAFAALTPAMVHSLNPEADWTSVRAEVQPYGYPVA